MLLSAAQSLLLVVDIQERLAPAIDAADAAIKNTRILLQCAERLGVPYRFSEQYAKGLGRTVGELSEFARPDKIIEKTHFSCAAEPGALSELQRLRRSQVVILGMETHVCVLQSAVGLQQAGMDVFVVQDAVGSRTAANKLAGLDRLREGGIQVVTTEMVVFEWLHKAATDEFKQLVGLIK
jgi:nicotinamidase-related amidase